MKRQNLKFELQTPLQMNLSWDGRGIKVNSCLS